MKKFLRRTSNRYSKLGRKRKKKQKWRRPTGRDNKMREKRKGYPKIVSIGYKKSEKEKQKPILVNNISDLKKVKSNNLIIGKVGKKKRIEIVKKAKEMNLQISNINVEKLLKKSEKIKKNQNKKWI